MYAYECVLVFVLVFHLSSSSLLLSLFSQDVRVDRMGNPQLLMQIHDELIYEVAVVPASIGSRTAHRYDLNQNFLVFKTHISMVFLLKVLKMLQ